MVISSPFVLDTCTVFAAKSTFVAGNSHGKCREHTSRYNSQIPCLNVHGHNVGTLPRIVLPAFGFSGSDLSTDAKLCIDFGDVID